MFLTVTLKNSLVKYKNNRRKKAKQTNDHNLELRSALYNI